MQPEALRRGVSEDTLPDSSSLTPQRCELLTLLLHTFSIHRKQGTRLASNLQHAELTPGSSYTAEIHYPALWETKKKKKNHARFKTHDVVIRN